MRSINEFLSSAVGKHCVVVFACIVSLLVYVVEVVTDLSIQGLGKNPGLWIGSIAGIALLYSFGTEDKDKYNFRASRNITLALLLPLIIAVVVTGEVMIAADVDTIPTNLEFVSVSILSLWMTAMGIFLFTNFVRSFRRLL